MARATTPSFVVTRRIYADQYQYEGLNRIMRINERMYNAGVRYCRKQMEELKKDIWYQHCLSKHDANKDETEGKLWSNEIFLCAEAYGLTEHALQAYMGQGKKSGYNKGIGINIVQKNATALYSSVKKALFGKRLHFRKFEQTSSFEDKRANSGIIYNSEKDEVVVCGIRCTLKPVREKDTWLKAAMEHRVKYCRIIRKPSGIHYRFFLQLVMEGTPPQRKVIGAGTLAIDPGVSTMTAYTGKEIMFEELACNIEKYQQEVRKEQNRFSKLMRINNPDCYDSEGRHIKGAKIKYSASMKRSRMRLKTAYRKQAEYVSQSNHHLANQWLEKAGSILKVESMNYKALQRKAKKKERQDKTSIVTTKAGKKRTIKKYKRRKRFGGSILKHAPAGFLADIKQKVSANGGIVHELKTAELKASQYDHVTGKCSKSTLD